MGWLTRPSLSNDGKLEAISRSGDTPPLSTELQLPVTSGRAGATGGVVRGARPPATLTHTRPAPAAIPVTERPTWIVATTLFLSGSMRETVPSPESSTQTPPSPTAIAVGRGPTRIVPATVFVRGSIRVTVLASAFATQTES
jgi:hypothetical protein